MKGDRDKLHERVFGGLAANLLCADSLYRPHQWRKGKGVREPADLIWDRDTATILFWLASQSPRAMPRKAQWQRTQKMIGHNLRQAKGAMRMWRQGYVLTGKHPVRSLFRPHQLCKHVVLISVVDGALPVAIYHGDRVRSLQVSMCLTLPSAVVRKIASVGAGFADFLLIGRFLEMVGGTLGERDALALVDEYVERARISSGYQTAFGAVPFDPERCELFRLLTASRRGFPVYFDHKNNLGLITNPTAISECIEVLSDLPLRDVMAICATYEQIRLQDQSAHLQGCAGVEGELHDIIVLSAPNGQVSPKIMRGIDERIQGRAKSNPNGRPLIIVHDPVNGFANMLCVALRETSIADRVLSSELAEMKKYLLVRPGSSL
ncbi:MAG TPA: hypothetical protein VG797_09775 [Phycisphaerales bacterium]|nr:hypothetical protein [Phycisphaerales bacterium]